MPATVHTRPFDLLSPLLDVLWADGRMSFAQVRAVDQVASLMGVDDVATRIASVHLAEFDDALPPPAVRAVAYALAVWVAAADGRIHPDERRVLNHFERYWDLSPDIAQRTRRLALGMARVGAGRPTRTQLEALIRAAQQLSIAHSSEPGATVTNPAMEGAPSLRLHLSSDLLDVMPAGGHAASTAAGGAA